MNDAYVEQIGVWYRAWVDEGTRLRSQIEYALECVNSGDVDPAFGRELVAALGNLEACPAI